MLGKIVRRMCGKGPANVSHRPGSSLCRFIVPVVLLVFPNLCLLAADSPRTMIPLDSGWRFALREDADAPAAVQFDDSAWEQISLPHTWNAFDGQDGGADYFRGTGWYRTRFRLPPDAKGRRVLLEFDGANRDTEVFLNGRNAGRHTGGFARFRFDVTGLLNFSKDNLLAVRVNNATNDFIPRGGDFTQCGGLYRKVRVLLTATAHIATLDHASPGVFLSTPSLTTNAADVTARVKLANDSDRNFSGKLQVIIRDAAGKEVTSTVTSTAIAANSSTEVNLILQIPQPHLWDGVADPYCYRATAELVGADGNVLDAVEQPLGLRSFAVKPDAGFFLNGRHIGLHGVNCHQDRLDKGWAVDTNDMTEDFKILQELGANTVRLCHYQHDQFFYDLCDHGGLAVWAELCFVNGAPETDAGRANAVEQLRELIRQNFNHPAIFFWSVGNETSGKSNNAEGQRCDRLISELAAVARAEDPTRLSTYASHHAPEDPRNFHTDIVAVNKYSGWYWSDYSDLGKWLDKFHYDHPEGSLGISEYGAGASIYQHEENPPVRTHQANGPWHPEEWQSRFYEESWLQIKARPWLWGAFIWCMFDFASDHRREGDTTGRNDKGLVTDDRQTRKDAFYWYQANWTTEPMVHITSKRFCERSVAKAELKIYSNCDQVEAWLNGVSLGKTNSADCRFIWPTIELIPGPNRLRAVSYRAGKPVASDSGAWTYRADGDPLPNKPVAQKDEEIEKERAAKQKELEPEE